MEDFPGQFSVGAVVMLACFLVFFSSPELIPNTSNPVKEREESRP
jgi:hypothetical protein